MDDTMDFAYELQVVCLQLLIIIYALLKTPREFNNDNNYRSDNVMTMTLKYARRFAPQPTVFLTVFSCVPQARRDGYKIVVVVDRYHHSNRRRRDSVVHQRPSSQRSAAVGPVDSVRATPFQAQSAARPFAPGER